MVNRTPRNKFQWNSNQYVNIFIEENSFENVVCGESAILSQPQWVNCQADDSGSLETGRENKFGTTTPGKN